MFKISEIEEEEGLRSHCVCVCYLWHAIQYTYNTVPLKYYATTNYTMKNERVSNLSRVSF